MNNVFCFHITQYCTCDDVIATCAYVQYVLRTYRTSNFTVFFLFRLDYLCSAVALIRTSRLLHCSIALNLFTLKFNSFGFLVPLLLKKRGKEVSFWLHFWRWNVLFFANRQTSRGRLGNLRRESGILVCLFI